MSLTQKLLNDGWTVKVWPNMRGCIVVLDKVDDLENVGHGLTYKRALKKAARGVKLPK